MIRITLNDWEGWRADFTIEECWRADFTINGKHCSGRAARLDDFDPKRDWWSVYDLRHALLEAAGQVGVAGFDASKAAAYLREHGIGSTWSDGTVVV